VRKPVQLAGCFHNNERHLGNGQFLAQAPDALFAVGKAERLASWMQINVEPRPRVKPEGML